MRRCRISGWLLISAAVVVAGCAGVETPSEPAASVPPVEGRVDGAALAQAKDCMVCHDVRLPKVGPALRDVARRYANLANGRELLIGVVQTGSPASASFGHWGSLDMPPDSARVAVSEAEAGVLVDYVLSLK